MRGTHLPGIVSRSPKKLLYSFECEPSQKAPFFECLQPHHATFFAAGKSTLMGENADPLCEPSQNGCFFDCPQEHHQ